MNITDIAAAVAAAKSVGDLVKLLRDSKASAAVLDKAIELQSDIINLQTTLMATQLQNQELLRDKRHAEKKLVEMENWTEEAKNYELAEIALGIFVYLQKVPKQQTASPPWFCTNCYQDGKASIYQRRELTPDGYAYRCARCPSEFINTGEGTSAGVFFG